MIKLKCKKCVWYTALGDCQEPEHKATHSITCWSRNNYKKFLSRDKPATPKNSVMVNKLRRENAELKAKVAVLHGAIVTGKLLDIIREHLKNRRAAK